MATNLTLPFSALGGTAPYVYSIAPNGVGGSIDSSSGLYTSPDTTGVDEVVVTDSLGATAELAIAVCTPIELVCEVIQRQMRLGPGQVYLYNQKIIIPTDSAVYVAVGVISCKPFSNNREFVDNGASLNEVQSTNFQASLSIDILSRSIQALNRKEEIILALGSSYAESQMELNSFYIAPITSSFINLSELDGAAIPYRFNLSVNVQYFTQKTTSVPFYSTYQTPQIVPNS